MKLNINKKSIYFNDEEFYLLLGDSFKLLSKIEKKSIDINNDEMQDVWRLPAVHISEKKFGYHPTQKPECLLERIILSCTKKGDIVLDPFLGSGTTCVVAKRLKRKHIGIEKEINFFKLSSKRIENVK